MIAPGATWKSFAVTARLGQGGMGEVFRARDTNLGREVALKVVRADRNDPGRLERLRQEARVLASLNHSAIAGIYGLEADGDQPVLILEFVEGQPLNAVLGLRALPVNDACAAAAQIAAALAAAHAQGIVHRDLKPSNVIMTPGGGVKLLDFGLAKVMAAGNGDDESVAATDLMSADGAVSGTGPYLSPEQLRGQAVDARVDVWGFGCLLYEMLTGVRAFRTVADTLERDPDWSRLPAGTPDAIRDLLERCLRRSPERRLPNLAAAVLVLEQGASPVRRVAPSWRWAWVVAGVLVVAAMGWAARDWRRAQPAAAAPVVAASGGAGSRPRVAVLTFEAADQRSGSSWVGAALRESLAANLAAGDALDVVPALTTARMAFEIELPATLSYTVDGLARVRAYTGADTVVAGRWRLAADGALTVDLRVQQTQAGETVVSETDVGTASSLSLLTARLGDRVRPVFGLAPSAETLDETAAALPRAIEPYVAGLDRFALFDWPEAVRHFEQAAREDPASPQPHVALSQVWAQLQRFDRSAAAASEAARLAAALPWRQRELALAVEHEAQRRWPEAIASYRQLDASPVHRVTHRAALARALTAAGHRDEALAGLTELGREAPPIGDDPWLALAEAEWGLAAGDNVRGQAAADRCARTASARGMRWLQARCRGAEARMLVRLARHDEAKTSAREAQRHFQALGDRAGSAGVLHVISIAMYYEGDLEGSRRLAEQAASVARAIGSGRLEANALSQVAIIDILEGKLDSAIRNEEEVLRIRREMNDRRGVMTSMHNLAESLQGLGRLDAAASRQREGLAIAIELGDRSLEATIRSGIADVHAARGRITEAEAEYRVAIAARVSLGELGTEAATRLALATILLDTGRATEAEAEARAAVAAFARAKQPDREAWAASVLARSLVAGQKLAEAARLIDEARPKVEASTFVRARVMFAVGEAAVLAASGTAADRRRATQSLDRAWTESLASGSVGRQFDVRLARASLDCAEAATIEEGRQELLALERDSLARDFRLVGQSARTRLAQCN
jgi:tRNA A-37 threonylcarbamoyl transferase component Bud32/tetratricopeptide (TPR) repeat protein